MQSNNVGVNPMIRNTTFEIRRINIDENGRKIPALRVVLSDDSQGNKKTIYENTIRLGVNDCKLPFPDQYDMSITKDGTLKIDRCETNNNMVFKLDNKVVWPAPVSSDTHL